VCGFPSDNPVVTQHDDQVGWCYIRKNYRIQNEVASSLGTIAGVPRGVFVGSHFRMILWELSI